MSVEIREFTGPVSGLMPLMRAAAPTVPGLNLLPGLRKARPADFEGLGLRRSGVRIDPAQVRAYERVCGFPRKDTLPLPFVHLLAFPLHLALMADPGFGWPAMGTVHLENTITAHRPIGPDEVLDVTVTVDRPRSHAQGTLLDFVSRVHSGPELVWEEVSTYLSRGTPPGVPTAGLELAAAPVGATEWCLSGDLGRRYAGVSGDLNPIHLSALSAKVLGFDRQIAHGMWSLARCLASVENRLPDAVQVAVAFKKPIFLPSTVAFGVEALPTEGPGQPNLAFALTRPRDGAPHLLGRTTAR